MDDTLATLRGVRTFLAGLHEHWQDVGEMPEFWQTVDDLRARVDAALAELDHGADTGTEP